MALNIVDTLSIYKFCYFHKPDNLSLPLNGWVFTSTFVDNYSILPLKARVFESQTSKLLEILCINIIVNKIISNTFI